jgi:cytochrome c oxidase subunit 1/cytochrome c oxidase subunit I+III
MHIVGILGMPRRNYTYPPGMGWTLLNFIESIGSYLLTAGLVLIVANLVYSFFRGPQTEPPFEGDTLEWATSSPPPPYNFAVIPTVRSPYPMWDKDDRKRDEERLARGEGLLNLGHETPATTAQDAQLDEILTMPSHSPWPPLTALALTGIFVMLVMQHYWIAVGFLVVGGLTLLGWHKNEEQP